MSNLLSLGTNDIEVAQQDEGLDYGGYLKILLYLESTDEMIEKVMDMVEHNIQVKYEETTFRVDQCISNVCLDVQVEVGMGFSYQFPIKYKYR